MTISAEINPDSQPNREDRRHPERLLDCDDAARYLKTTPRHIRAMWESRELAAVKIGRLVRYDPVDLDAYIQRRRVEAVR